jgi:hypothetical protein
VAVIDPTFALSNRLEAAFWALIALGMLVAALRNRGEIRRDCAIAAITFALFGGSDLVEATTGAWWRPWWLFVWKAICVLVFVVLLARYLHRRKR